MNRRTLLSSVALSGVLLTGVAPVATLAQDATPVALAPPQDLLKTNTLTAEGQTAEINECPALLEASLRLIGESVPA